MPFARGMYQRETRLSRGWYTPPHMETSPRQLYKLTASGFILDAQGRLLLLKRKEDDPLLPGFWQAPGGAVETGEPVEASVARQTKDQAGLDVACDKLFGHFEYPDASHQLAVNLNFSCSLRDPSQFVTLGHDMAEQAWSDLLGLTNYKMTPEMYEACRWALGTGKK